MKRLISAICVLFFLLPLSAQETYQKETFISSRGDTLQYRLLQPENMKRVRSILWCSFCMVQGSVVMIMRGN